MAVGIPALLGGSILRELNNGGCLCLFPQCRKVEAVVGSWICDDILEGFLFPV